MKRMAILIFTMAWSVRAFASRYSDAMGDDGEEHVERFSDGAQLAIYVLIGLAAFVFFTWDEKRAWLRWGSRACLALALVFLVTKPELLTLFIFGPIAAFFAWPLISWLVSRKKDDA